MVNRFVLIGFKVTMPDVVGVILIPRSLAHSICYKSLMHAYSFELNAIFFIALKVTSPLSFLKPRITHFSLSFTRSSYFGIVPSSLHQQISKP